MYLSQISSSTFESVWAQTRRFYTAEGGSASQPMMSLAHHIPQMEVVSGGRRTSFRNSVALRMWYTHKMNAPSQQFVWCRNGAFGVKMFEKKHHSISWHLTSWHTVYTVQLNSTSTIVQGTP